jgi:hypothetical protein
MHSYRFGSSQPFHYPALRRQRSGQKRSNGQPARLSRNRTFLVPNGVVAFVLRDLLTNVGRIRCRCVRCSRAYCLAHCSWPQA